MNTPHQLTSWPTIAISCQNNKTVVFFMLTYLFKVELFNFPPSQCFPVCGCCCCKDNHIATSYSLATVPSKKQLYKSQFLLEIPTSVLTNGTVQHKFLQFFYCYLAKPGKNNASSCFGCTWQTCFVCAVFFFLVKSGLIL